MDHASMPAKGKKRSAPAGDTADARAEQAKKRKLQAAKAEKYIQELRKAPAAAAAASAAPAVLTEQEQRRRARAWHASNKAAAKAETAAGAAAAHGDSDGDTDSSAAEQLQHHQQAGHSGGGGLDGSDDMDYDSSDADLPSVAVRKQAAAHAVATRTQRAAGSSGTGGAGTNGVRSASHLPPLPANAAHVVGESAAGKGSGSGNRGTLAAFVEAQAQQPNVVLMHAFSTGMAAAAAGSGDTAGGSSSGLLARHVQGAYEGQAAGLSSGNRGGCEVAAAGVAHVAQALRSGVTASAALPPYRPAAERVEAADLSALRHRRAAANKVAAHMGHAAAPMGRLCFGDNIPQVAREPCAKWVPCPPAGECAGGAVVRCAQHFELADDACVPEASVRAEAERAKRVLHDNVELHYCRGGALRGLPLPADRCLDEAVPCSTPREVFHHLLHQGLLSRDFTVLHGSRAFALTREEHSRVKHELPLTCRLRR
ncbi:hypothetical protein JKP88DRAFT_312686 [Tribonema minus]|uniref:Uncharacterized protein n=1 Tax=Tribonema minus TaxID=303371 RepID=A0A835Z5F4_9STRA|nr:hypothetical protein JKP88DRAFT_312686 [Tribonema minus]